MVVAVVFGRGTLTTVAWRNCCRRRRRRRIPKYRNYDRHNAQTTRAGSPANSFKIFKIATATTSTYLKLLQSATKRSRHAK